MPTATEHPTIWRLRAEIIELAYAGAVTTDEQAIADADWARFAQSQGTSVELARLAARGEAAAAATGAPTKSGVQPTSRRPSAPTLVWYGSGEGAAAARSAVTATAVVLDATGARRLVLPDYVLNGVGPNEVLRFSLAPGEPAVAEARAADIVRPEGGAAGVARPGVVLARILPTADKLLATASVVRTLAEAGPRPGAGETLTISTQQRQSEVTVAAVASDDGGLLPVDRKVTEGGDGGAPVVDSQGRLVAMAYLASPERSYFLPLAWLWGPGSRYTLAR